MHIIDKLFGENAYGIAIREINSPDDSYKTKYPNIFHWYADPFICSTPEGDYVFVELMDYHVVYGQIAVAPVKNGKIGSFKIIISEPFHMSFPNVFQWKDEWYMIPETYQAKQVRLYKCNKFPYEWSLSCVLLDNVELVDHAIYQEDNKVIMISYNIADPKKKYNNIYELDLESKVIHEIHPRGKICNDRAGGTIYHIQGKLRRTIQDCTTVYGEFLRIYEINKINLNEIIENEIKQIHASDVPWDKNRGIKRIHTYNRNNKYEVIDFLYRKKYPNKFIIKIWVNYILKSRKHK